MTATYADGRVLQAPVDQPLAQARAEGHILPPHRTGITRDALDALARTNNRTRQALASTARPTGSRREEP